MAPELGVGSGQIRFIHHAGFYTIDEFARGVFSLVRGSVVLTNEELVLVSEEYGTDDRPALYRIPLAEIDGVGKHSTQVQIQHRRKLTILRMYEFSRYTLSIAGATELREALVAGEGLPQFEVTETFGLSEKHRGSEQVISSPQAGGVQYFPETGGIGYR